MPEFPEVFTITKNLNHELSGAKLLDIEILDYHPKVSSEKELKSLIGFYIKEVKNISKNIIFEFSNNKYIVCHLAMTGRFRKSKEQEIFGWDKLRLKFQKNQETFYINFTDTRKFGKFQLKDKVEISETPNPLFLNNIEKEKVANKILKSNKSIKEILLNQNIISGLGNIYCNDTLHKSKINPTTKGNELNKEKIYNILENAKKVLQKGIDSGGSSLNDKMYTDIYGNEGKYQNYFAVYNLKLCKDCGNEIDKIKINGRGTYYCKSCLNM